jgi:hypothetical protein
MSVKAVHKSRIQVAVVTEFWTVATEFWTVATEFWAVATEFWAVATEFWAVATEFWTVATEFWTVATNICGPLVWNLFHATLLESRILKWLLNFLKIYIPYA